MLTDAGISPQEQEKNGDTIVEVMQFYQDQDKDNNDKVFDKMGAIRSHEQLNVADSEEAEDTIVEIKKAGPPVIPSRPAHTMSVYSTDIKKGIIEKLYLRELALTSHRGQARGEEGG